MGASLLSQVLQLEIVAANLLQVADNVLAHLAALIGLVEAHFDHGSLGANVNLLVAECGGVKDFLRNGLHNNGTILLHKVIAAALVDKHGNLGAKVVHNELLNLLFVLVVVEFILNEVSNQLTLNADHILVSNGGGRCGLHIVPVDVVPETLRHTQAHESTSQVGINVLSEHLNEALCIVGDDSLAIASLLGGQNQTNFVEHIDNLLVGGVVLQLALNDVDNLFANVAVDISEGWSLNSLS